MSERVNKTFILKRVNIISNSSGHSFFELLKNALLVWPKASQRRYEVERDSDRFRVFNDYVLTGENHDVIVGSIFAFTMNANQNAVVLNEDLDTYPIEVLAPSRDEGHHQEFLDGLIWFAAMSNQIAIMTNPSVSLSLLEEYFSWMFSKTRNETVQVAFIDPPTKRFRECDMSTARKIVISSGVDVTARDSTTVNGVTRRRFVLGGRGWDVVKSVFKSLGETPPKLSVSGEHALDKLNVSVVISSGRVKAGTGEQADAVPQIANAFKDIENPPVKIEFANGQTVSLKEFRVSKKQSIQSRNKIPDPEETCRLLDAWLREQVASMNLATV